MPSRWTVQANVKRRVDSALPITDVAESAAWTPERSRPILNAASITAAALAPPITRAFANSSGQDCRVSDRHRGNRRSEVGGVPLRLYLSPATSFRKHHAGILTGLQPPPLLHRLENRHSCVTATFTPLNSWSVMNGEYRSPLAPTDRLRLRNSDPTRLQRAMNTQSTSLPAPSSYRRGLENAARRFADNNRPPSTAAD